jgi:protein-tyrosine phosphatase
MSMMQDRAELSVLFVCLGNICRSPTAEGVFRRLARDAGLDGRVRVDSAGTGGYHIGASPDARALAAAQARGYDLSGIRARKIAPRISSCST